MKLELCTCLVDFIGFVTSCTALTLTGMGSDSCNILEQAFPLLLAVTDHMFPWNQSSKM